MPCLLCVGYQHLCPFVAVPPKYETCVSCSIFILVRSMGVEAALFPHKGGAAFTLPAPPTVKSCFLCSLFSCLPVLPP